MNKCPRCGASMLGAFGTSSVGCATCGWTFKRTGEYEEPFGISALNPSSASIESAIKRAIEREAALIVEEEAEKAAKEAAARAEKRVREKVGAIAAGVLSAFSYQQMAHELIIRVNFSHNQNPNQQPE